MKAAVLTAFGTQLGIEDLPDPIARSGEVLVDVVAAPVAPYAREVFSGERHHALETPIVPGCGAIGRVRAVGGDATRLAAGDWVLCDPTVRARDDARTPDITLQGWSARGDGGLRLQRTFHDGPFAERMLVPTENAVALGAIDATDAGRWCALNLLLVPYGGLLAIGLQAGETIVVSGATGNYGSGAVAVALAMGAGCVVAPGRDAAVLAELVRRFGSRVRPVSLTGDETEDTDRMTRAAPGPIDCVLDLLPPAAGPRPVQAAIATVREFGRVALMGGVGFLGGDELSISYRWLMRQSITLRGRWMYPREAVPQLIALARSGLLDLGQFAVTSFSLDRAKDAVAHAAIEKRRFELTVISPDGTNL